MKNNRKLQSLLKDRQSGSQDLLIKINKLLLQNINDKNSLLEILDILKKSFLQFQLLNTNFNNYEKLISDDRLEKLQIQLQSSKQRFDDTYQNIFINLYSHYNNSKMILTLSNSRTVIEILKFWKKKNQNLQTVVCESRPKFEGRIAAKELVKNGLKTFLIAEALMAKFISKCDLVLIGTDSIFQDESVINKTGSMSAAIIAKYFNKPFVVVTSKEKFRKQNHFFVKEENPAEIFQTRNTKLKPVNIYFEVIPKNLITKIITD